MRTLVAIAVALVLAGCQLTLPGRGGGEAATDSSPITGGDIATTKLDPVAAAAAQPAPAPAGGADKGTADTGTEGVKPAQPDPVKPADGKPADVAPPDNGKTDAAKPGAVDPAAAAAVPDVVKPPEQIACERQGGAWSALAHTKARACVRRTRDGGRSCNTKSDCQGQCLARSGTCAPLDPLFGCNDVLERGRQVTVCID
ncbi:MAG: hypothetical protein QM656_16205 [Paracoccaceae bacterium]